jgi:hypothetical protein
MVVIVVTVFQLPVTNNSQKELDDDSALPFLQIDPRHSLCIRKGREWEIGNPKEEEREEERKTIQAFTWVVFIPSSQE